MCHVAHSALGTTVRGGGGSSVGAVAGHAGGEDDAALGLGLDEKASGGGSTVPGAKDVELEELLDLVHGEVKGRLMLSSTGVGDHSVESTLSGKDGVESRGDRLFVGHICIDELELALESLLKAGKVITRLGNIEGVDGGSGVVEADLCKTQTNALVGTGDC